MINGRDGQPKNLGIKRFSAQKVKAGTIILKQHGRVFKPGRNVGAGRDDTLYALIDGKVVFGQSKVVSVVKSAK